MYNQYLKRTMCGQIPQPIRDGEGAIDPGLRDIMRDLEHPHC